MFKPWSLFVVFCSKLSYLGENLINSVGIFFFYYDFYFLFVIKSAKGFFIFGLGHYCEQIEIYIFFKI